MSDVACGQGAPLLAPRGSKYTFYKNTVPSLGLQKCFSDHGLMGIGPSWQDILLTPVLK